MACRFSSPTKHTCSMIDTPSEAQRDVHTIMVHLNYEALQRQLHLLEGHNIAIAAQRDALQQVIDRMTSMLALEAAANAYHLPPIWKRMHASSKKASLWSIRAAITAALAAASAHNEGGEG